MTLATGIALIKYLINTLAILYLVVAAINWGVSKTDWGRDDSDHPTGERSGLKVYTDHKTGVQYLSTPSGALTPRIYSDGAIVIKK